MPQDATFVDVKELSAKKLVMINFTFIHVV
jgi:hypothetical protein